MQIVLELQNVRQQIDDFQLDESAIQKQRLDEFVQQISPLEKRKVELHRNEQKILQMMNEISERKTETFMNMLNLLNQHFTQIFKKFVPNGRAALVPKVQGESLTRNTDIDKVVGIEMRASLQGAGHAESSIIALSLILAIQKCSPSPFYLIDSVDEVVFDFLL